MSSPMDVPPGGGGPRSSEAAGLNREIYDRLARGQLDYWRYMAAPRFRTRRLLSLLEEQLPTVVADLGCGTGGLLQRVRERLPDARRVGFDLAAEQLRVARAEDPAARWEVLDLDDPSPRLPDDLVGRCEALVAAEVVEHLDHPTRALRTVGRLAAPGARLFLSTQSGPMRATERRVGHRRHFSAAEMAATLEDGGWEPVRVWNEGWPFHDLSKWWANRRPERSMERFGERPYGLRERAVCWILRGLFRLNSRRRGAQLFAVARLPAEPVSAQDRPETP